MQAEPCFDTANSPQRLCVLTGSAPLASFLTETLSITLTRSGCSTASATKNAEVNLEMLPHRATSWVRGQTSPCVENSRTSGIPNPHPAGVMTSQSVGRILRPCDNLHIEGVCSGPMRSPGIQKRAFSNNRVSLPAPTLPLKTAYHAARDVLPNPELSCAHGPSIPPSLSPFWAFFGFSQ